MAARNQPTYDFLTGAGTQTPPRPRAKRHEEYRQNQELNVPIEDLHARIRTLEYETATLKQEKELSQVQHDQDIRELTEKAEEEYRRSQKFESASTATQRRYDTLLRESQDVQSALTNEKLDLERRVRTVTGQKTSLEEERDEAQEALANFERENGRNKGELEVRHSTLQKSFDMLRADFDAQLAATQTAQGKLAERDAQVGQLEAQVVSLKALGGDAETEVVKRQLTEQVIQITRLEKTNRLQSAELAEYRKLHKSMEVIEEEKRGLEARLKIMDTLRNELAQVQLRAQVLEEEKNAWATYLEDQTEDDKELQFNSPEDMAKAFMQQRIENASLVERLGAVQPEVFSKDETIHELEAAISKLQSEIEQLKTAAPSVPAFDGKAKARLERQKTLAIKETEYLRAQLKAMDEEEKEFHPERHSEEVNNKIKELQDLVDEYRKEIQQLHSNLSASEKPVTPASPSNPRKRSLEDGSDERLGELLRKNRKLQEEFSKLRTRNDVLENEAKAQNKQLVGLRSDSSSRHRILELRNNPTSQVQAIKQSTIDALRSEIETLRAQIEGQLPTSSSSGRKSSALVPQASLLTLQLALQEKDALIASKDKSQKRLRDIFAAKAHEFREAVFSLLGWKLEFQPNGRVKATSMFYPGPKKGEEDEEGNFIVFDGENATMKVSGGVKSEFAKEIRGLVDFWVEGRGQVPCLLAAMTLEFWEKYHDGKPGNK